MRHYDSSFLDTLATSYRRALKTGNKNMIRQVLSVCKEIGIIRADSRNETEIGNKKVDKYKKHGIIKVEGRVARGDADSDDADGYWVTTENGHKVHISGEGEPDKGHPAVLSTMAGTGGSSGTKPTGSYPKVRGVKPTRVRNLLDKMRTSSKRFYDKATEVAKNGKNTVLWTFTSHGPDHIEQVVNETMQAADAMEDLQAHGGFLKGDLDREMLLAAAQYHDTGMDGGIKDYSKDNGNQLRKEHGFNSAMHILEDAKVFESMGINPSKAAFLALAHTKSNSGIKDLTKPSDWKTGLDNMEKSVREYNERADELGIPHIEFDRNAVFGGEPTADNIGSMANMVAALRLGDANREANIPLKSQAGGEYKIEHLPGSGCKSADEEAAEAVISITDVTGRHELSKDDLMMSKVAGFEYSKKVVLGEQNLMTADAVFDKKTNSLQEAFVLKHGNVSPHCTCMALEERLGEMNTINGIPRSIRVRLTGVANTEAMNKETTRAYQQLWRNIMTDREKIKDPVTGEKKNGAYKFGGIDELIIEFDDGTEHAFSRETSNNPKL